MFYLYLYYLGTYIYLYLFVYPTRYTCTGTGTPGIDMDYGFQFVVTTLYIHVMCTPCWSWSNWKLENYVNAVHHVDKEGGHSYLLLLPPSMTHLLSTNVLLHCWAQWIPGIHWAVPFSHCVVWPPPEPFLLNTRFSHPCSTTNDESPTTCCPLL